jgi:hypothetical protein
MAFSFKAGRELARRGFAITWIRWLQLAICALVGWAWLRTEPGNPPPVPARATAPVASPQPVVAASPPPGTATIDVVIGRNDTLDRIFRKLKLSLADLAALRSLPGMKTHLDNLRLGEALHLTYRDAELDGLERRLNESQTLRVVREAGTLRADVLANPLEARTRTVRGVIDRSLFEAVAAAGAHDQATPSRWPISSSIRMGFT